ncbi:hypothetical protein HNQ91_004772 [Filimonas zeae]|uniref:Secretion system C-terminal sorting domain-containing protein n=1 Tax=Filimonas zeae TaxID=1737353 RepID=A0A917J0L9_9BACT|nr:T9SS type A sorting domain-containing protein [Filimonas zeae]MDR6341699.1 hypothetical protein [Filimonas zeae]GGH74584.1 hypothetical protein GCM10011379_37300 [Filimonas zeae]
MKQILHSNFLRASRFGKSALLLVLLIAAICAFSRSDIWEAGTSVAVVKCYPNPATSFINFEFATEIDKTHTLYIYSFVGRKMYEQPVTGKKVVVTLNNYYRGIYVFQLRDKTGRIIETGKFQVEQ